MVAIVTDSSASSALTVIRMRDREESSKNAWSFAPLVAGWNGAWRRGCDRHSRRRCVTLGDRMGRVSVKMRWTFGLLRASSSFLIMRNIQIWLMDEASELGIRKRSLERKTTAPAPFSIEKKLSPVLQFQNWIIMTPVLCGWRKDTTRKSPESIKSG